MKKDLILCLKEKMFLFAITRFGIIIDLNI